MIEGRRLQRFYDVRLTESRCRIVPQPLRAGAGDGESTKVERDSPAVRHDVEPPYDGVGQTIANVDRRLVGRAALDSHAIGGLRHLAVEHAAGARDCLDRRRSGPHLNRSRVWLACRDGIAPVSRITYRSASGLRREAHRRGVVVLPANGIEERWECCVAAAEIESHVAAVGKRALEE